MAGDSDARSGTRAPAASVAAAAVRAAEVLGEGVLGRRRALSERAVFGERRGPELPPSEPDDAAFRAAMRLVFARLAEAQGLLLPSSPLSGLHARSEFARRTQSGAAWSAVRRAFGASGLEQPFADAAIYRAAREIDQALTRGCWAQLRARDLGDMHQRALGMMHARARAEHSRSVRRRRGVYYTPPIVVEHLLDQALHPVIAEAVAGRRGACAARAILRLRVLDPAAGGGAFLIAAAERLGASAGATLVGAACGGPEIARRATRAACVRCVFGVELDPGAAEVCRLALWLTAREPSLPLTAFDDHVRVSNTLLEEFAGPVVQPPAMPS